MIIQVDKETYLEFSDTEKSVVDYLNENEAKIPDMSITTIAEQTFTSISTVSRAIHKCGFQSIAELKYKILAKRNKEEEPYIANEMLLKTYRECMYTIDNIRTTQILKVIEFIKNSKRIYLFARGSTVLIAEEFYMFLEILNYDAHLIKDAVWMVNTDKILKEGDTAIFLTLHNTTSELTDAAKQAKSVGAKVVTCCCVEHPPIEEYSDIMLVGHTEEVITSSFVTANSRLALYIIVRAIAEYLGV